MPEDAPPAVSQRALDVVVHGASGFVGRFVAGRLARTAPASVRIGLAGRSRSRLEAVRAGLGPRAADWPLLVADSADDAALERLARGTAVVASTVGPYARHGLPLVLACARAGTHYADLTGEVSFVRASIDAAHALARASGARIVHSCGFDSVPSDLAVLALAQRAVADATGGLTRTQLALEAARGGLSGGTVDSLRSQLAAAAADPAVRALLADPYALSPDRAAEPTASGRRRPLPRYDRDARIWTAPFVMAPFNTRIVRRSNALTGWSYGPGFAYSEVVGCGRGPLAPVAAAAVSFGTAAAVAALAAGPTRALADRVLPAPGAGPSERTQALGHFRIRARAHTSGGARYVATVAAHGDPGYAATAVMLGESALALLGEPAGPVRGGGVLTPATALGGALSDRLRAGGFELTVDRVE